MRNLAAIIVAILVTLTAPLYGQLTIEQCQKEARENYPLIERLELIKKSEEYSLSNANKGYLPQLSLSAQASYQSDVTQLPIKVPGVDLPTIDKDQYRVEATLGQVIWDGGVIGKGKELLRAQSEAEQKELEATLYGIRESVNNLFFGVLLLDAKLESLRLYEEQLGRNHSQMREYVKQGVATESDVDVVRVEMLNTTQSKTTLRANRRAYIEMLSLFINRPIAPNEKFTTPSAEQHSKLLINRPELAFFDAKLGELNAQDKNITANLMPKLGLFVTGGYGKPGLNMLKNKFKPYYVAGVTLSWNFGALYTKSNDRRNVDIARQNVGIERETFLLNTRIDMKQEDNTIVKNRELLEQDDEIIRLRGNIRKAAEAKLANGTLSATDFMREVTAEEMAKQSKIEHQMELLISIYRHKHLTNN